MSQQEHNLRVLLAWEAGEITIGQARMLMGLWDGALLDHVEIRTMRDREIARVADAWKMEFADRHADVTEERP